jgi:hypothetical protein
VGALITLKNKTVKPFIEQARISKANEAYTHPSHHADPRIFRSAQQRNLLNPPVA